VGHRDARVHCADPGAGAKNKFVPGLLPVVEQIARLGAINSLSQVVLKLTAPACPIFTRATKSGTSASSIPDNRRPVDYAQRAEMLASLTNTEPAELLAAWPDGRIKMLVTQRLLRLRRDHGIYFSAAAMCR
jgi:(1->4)-alpha-D-glucan 1-alpha-D-glucosylmutase